MSLMDAIQATSTLVRVVYKIAMAIRESKELDAELKDIAKILVTDLTIVGGLLGKLQRFAQQVPTEDEMLIIASIDSLRSMISDAQNVLEEVRRNRNFFQRLFMKKDQYRRKLRDTAEHLHRSLVIIQGALPSIDRIKINRREFPDFRRAFQNLPEKDVSFYDFAIIEDTPHTISTITLAQFDAMRSLCYMKAANEQIYLSYQLRTWSALNPIKTVLEHRRNKFTKAWHNRSVPNLAGSNSSLNSLSSTHSQPQSVATAAANDTREKLDFSEFFMSHNDICGMTLTRSSIYIATKCEVTIFSLSKQKIIAQYGMEGDGPNTFRHISYIYIPPNDETNLYIVDCGQYAVHLYKIDDSGFRFEFVRRFVVIADVSQQCNLVSCVIFNGNLYVSDDINNCLHIFPLNGERQQSYLCDNSMTPFAPGSIATDGKYLYVANCSAESPGILIFNEECQPVDWFRHNSLQEILAIHIDLNINELYVLTTKSIIEDGERKKRPLIVSMNLILRT